MKNDYKGQTQKIVLGDEWYNMIYQLNQKLFVIETIDY